MPRGAQRTKAEAQDTPQEEPQAGLQAVPDPSEGEGRMTKDEALKRSYADAMSHLRDQHEDEFQAERTRIMHSLGFTDYKPKPKPAEVAQQTIETLLKAHPELREQYGR